MPADGGEAVRLTDLPNGVADPVWSPDSAGIVFVARTGGWHEPDSEQEERTSKPVRGGAMPWQDPARWVERSPITCATRIETPLLIIHSEDDLRCPISEAEQLFVALEMLGRDVTLVRFPDENHELSRSGKPRHRLERFRIILDWFARHLRSEERPRGGEAGAVVGRTVA